MRDEEIKLPTKVKFIYKRAEDYKQYFVNGAYGGFSPRGDFVCDFFFEFKEFPIEQEGNINPETNQIDIIPVPIIDTPEIVREVRLGIVMSPQQLMHLRDWLDKRITDFKEKYEVDA
jgi:hypothetical protein